MARLARQTSQKPLASTEEQQALAEQASIAMPQSPVSGAPRRSQRSTRAGSVDSVQSEASTTKAPRRNKGKGRAIEVKPDLDILPEQDEAEQEEQPQIEQLLDEQLLQGQEPYTQIAPVAEMSETGIGGYDGSSQDPVSHLATFELSPDVDAKDLVETLPALFLSSKRLLDLFLQEDDEEAVQTLARSFQGDSKLSQKFRKLDASFRPLREFYGYDRQCDPFINVDAIVAAIFSFTGQAFDGQGLRHILNVANLAICIAGVFTETEHQVNFLQVLDNICPRPFVSFLRAPGEAFEINLDIRTKLAVVRLNEERGRPGFDPVAILRSIFYVEDAAFPNYPTPRGIAGEEEEPRGEAINTRYNELAACIVVGVYEIDVDKLNHDFPWIDFLRLIIQYTSTEFDAFFENITMLGGDSKIVENLGHIVGSNTSISAAK